MKMDYPTRLDFCDGKYTVIYDFSTGQSECLRYGQPWRQLVGDKMVLAMFDRVVELQAENAALKNKLEMVEACLAGDNALIEGLKAELAAAQKDAARYRFVRSRAYVGISRLRECLWVLRGIYEVSGMKSDDVGFDAAIDKELAK